MDATRPRFIYQPQWNSNVKSFHLLKNRWANAITKFPNGNHLYAVTNGRNSTPNDAVRCDDYVTEKTRKSFNKRSWNMQTVEIGGASIETCWWQLLQNISVLNGILFEWSFRFRSSRTIVRNSMVGYHIRLNIIHTTPIKSIEKKIG